MHDALDAIDGESDAELTEFAESGTKQKVLCRQPLHRKSAHFELGQIGVPRLE